MIGAIVVKGLGTLPLEEFRVNYIVDEANVDQTSSTHHEAQLIHIGASVVVARGLERHWGQ